MNTQGAKGTKFLPGCTGKVPYFSLKEVQSEIKYLNRHSFVYKKLYSYRCKYTHTLGFHFHLTSMRRKDFKRKARSNHVISHNSRQERATISAENN